MSRPSWRPQALEQLSSPEALDELLRVTDPLHWLALLSGLALMILALGWGLNGTWPVTVTGRGLVTRGEAALRTVEAPSNGVVKEIRVGISDDTVAKDEVLMTLDLPELTQKVSTAERMLDLAQTLRNDLKSRNPVSVVLAVLGFDGRLAEGPRQVIAKTISDGYERIDKLQKEVDRLKGAGGLEGGGDPAAIAAFQKALKDLDNEIAASMFNRQLLQRIEAITPNGEGGQRSASEVVNRLIVDLMGELRALRKQIAQNDAVRAPVAGRVSEILVRPGSVITTGTPLIRLETGPATPGVIAYVPAAVGRRIAVGSDVRLTPIGVTAVGDHVVVGKILSVSSYPVTPEMMKIDLQNDFLFREFSQLGASFKLTIALPAVRVTASAASSGSADMVSGTATSSLAILTSGSLVSAVVVIDNVVPAHRLLGGGA